MFNYIKKQFGFISVREEGDTIHVGGLDGFQVTTDFKRYWKTGKIGDHIFTRVSKYGLSFHSFFAPDILYAIDVILNTGKKYYYSVRSISLMKEGILENTRFKSLNLEVTQRIDRARLKDLKLTPLSFQDEFFTAYNDNTQKYCLKGFLLAAAAGAGKSFTALALSHLLSKPKVLIICPMNALFDVWVKHITDKVFKDKKKYSTSKDAVIDYKKEFVIVHYEHLDKLVLNASSFNEDTMIILDESHNFNELKSNRTNKFIEFCKTIKAKDILLLSGTPIKAIPAESIPLFRAIDDLFIPEVEESFKRIYRSNNNRGTDILANRLGLVSFKVQKSELGLEPPIFKNVKIQIPNGKDYTLDTLKFNMDKFITDKLHEYKQRRPDDEKLYNDGLNIYKESLGVFNSKDKKELDLYKDYVNLLIKSQGFRVDPSVFTFCNKFELEKVYPAILEVDKQKAVDWKNIRSTIKYITLKVRGECLGQIVGGTRVRCHVDMVKYINFEEICESTVKKTVVFTSFVEVLERCMSELENRKLVGAFVYAKTNNKLQSIIASFKDDIKVNPLVATYKSLSTAVPLTMADTMILIDSPFRDYILQQAVSRIHRLDADTQTYVYVCELDTGELPNISQRSREILQWSQKQIEQIIGISSPFMLDDIEQLDNLNNSFENYNEVIDKYNYVIEEYTGEINKSPRFLDWK